MNPTLLWATVESSGLQRVKQRVKHTHTNTRSQCDRMVLFHRKFWMSYGPWSCTESRGIHCGCVILEMRSRAKVSPLYSLSKFVKRHLISIGLCEEISFFWCSTMCLNWGRLQVYREVNGQKGVRRNRERVDEKRTANTNKVRDEHCHNKTKWWPCNSPNVTKDETTRLPLAK